MKAIFFSFFLILVLLLSSVGVVAGLSYMAYDVLHAQVQENFMKSFELFSISSILLLVSITTFMVTKTLENSDSIMSALLNILKNQKGPATTTTFTALPPIVIDEDSPHHNLIKTLFGHMLGDQLQDSKKLEDMTIEELEKAKEKALADNKFEEAAKIRDLIEQKKK